MKRNYEYDRFSSIDGSHPFRESFPDGYVDYQVRKRAGGRVTYFNFNLAKEMGLLDKSHPHKLNDDLEHAVLNAFSIQIINEYDLEHGVDVDVDDIRPGTFMATRYLQLQHPDKRGKTSGDGRGIWNGSIKHAGKRWDITSCGTGATRLSPATVINGKYYQTGDPTVSYGCGYANIIDGLAAAIFSEILHSNGHSTERTLALIEYDEDISINVRAGHNLLRPSHLFRLVKLNQKDELKSAVKYWMDREVENGNWPKKSSFKAQMKHALKETCLTFARAAAKYESDYLFIWMDWDGDNILTDAGIIDYGSVRQFGLCHKDYRYDDDGRWSTNLLEQKQKARETIQTFAQITEYLLNGRKPTLKEMKSHPINQVFDKEFGREKLHQMALKFGFTEAQSQWLVTKHVRKLKKFSKLFEYFERLTCQAGPVDTGDGVSRNPSLVARLMFQFFATRLNSAAPIGAEEFMDYLRSEHATDHDIRVNPTRQKKVEMIQQVYLEIIEAVCQKSKKGQKRLLTELGFRCSILHKAERITGNSVVLIAEELLRLKPEMSWNKWHKAIEDFIHDQKLLPEKSPKSIKVLSPIQEIVSTYKQSI